MSKLKMFKRKNKPGNSHGGLSIKAKLILLTAIIMLSTACEKTCKVDQELVDGKCVPREVPPIPTKKHNMYAHFGNSLYTGNDAIDVSREALRDSARSQSVDTIFFVSLEDFQGMAVEGSEWYANYLDTIFSIVEGKGVGQGVFNPVGGISYPEELWGRFESKNFKFIPGHTK